MGWEGGIKGLGKIIWQTVGGSVLRQENIIRGFNIFVEGMNEAGSRRIMF